MPSPKFSKITLTILSEQRDWLRARVYVILYAYYDIAILRMPAKIWKPAVKKVGVEKLEEL
jgi:hypothetical protein